MKEDAVVSKQHLQYSGMLDVSYVRYSDKCLYRAFYGEEMLVSLLGETTWPLETNRQTFKTDIQDILAYSITK